MQASGSFVQELRQIEEDSLQYYCGFTQDELDQLHRTITLALDSEASHEGDLRSRWQAALVGVLRLRFQDTLDEQDLIQAQTIAEAVISTSPNSLAHILALFHLSRIAEQRREFLDNRTHLIAAVDYSRRAKALLESRLTGYDHLRNVLDVSLGGALVNLPFADGTETTQLEGISILEYVVSRIEDSDSLKALSLYFLSIGYSRLADYQPEKHAPHTFTALEFARHALEHAAVSTLSSRLFTNLASLHHFVYRLTADTSHIYDGIAAGERAIALVPARLITHDGGMHLRIPGELYMAKYETEGLIEDLDKFIKYHYAVIDGGVRSPFPYSNLCEALCIRFQETGAILDIDNAIRLGMTGVAFCEGSGWQAVYPLLYLGLAYTIRFLYDEDGTDYNAARGRLEDAIKLCEMYSPRFDSPRIHALEILATLFYAHYCIHRKASQLNLAVRYMRAAVAYPDERSFLPRRLSLLGECLLSQALAEGDSKQILDEAITKVTEAVDLTTSKSYNYHLLLWRRSCAFRKLLELQNDEPNFQKTLRGMMEALRHAQAIHHPKQAFYETEIASLFATRIKDNQAIDNFYLKEALEMYSQAANNSQGFIGDRFEAAVKGGELAMEFNLHEAALRLFTIAVELVPRIAWLGLNASRRHSKLVSSTSQLVCNAAAAAILSGELERAVELLEEGRSVLWKSMLDLQADVTALREVNPELATELRALGKALEYDDLGLETTADFSTEQRGQRRRRMAERWHSLLASVRQLEGFEAFLLPLSFSTLQSAAIDGPVVIFNASRYASHALVLQPGARIRSLSLPDLGHETLTNLVRLFSAAVKCTKDEKGCTFLEGVLTRISRYLWLHGISDVIQTFRGYPTDINGVTRIWLLPTGLFSLLPVHCAGAYDGHSRSLTELFIVSHTTTLSVLLNARKGLDSPLRGCGPPEREAQLLAVFQPDAPGLPTLWAALDEKKRLAQNIFPGAVSYLFGDTATVSAVKTGLVSHNWFHCCSHGTWRPLEPLKTALQLRDGPVQLFDLLPLRLKSTDFAFLSACHTARHAPFLPDECLHLAAALQVIGFRGVLATQWAMADCDGPLLADLFYRALGAGGRPADARNAAEALHKAVLVLRDRGIPLWRRAAFVHFGV